ncbi:Glycine decarboxlase T-protein (GDC-T) [Chara braunii]|uniref:Glycine decarboxlase T-protein (GDC-T) n=1 Tax=Chara braunii TaxID=69332 RepID=A0A388JXI2_CHABU|nr:Glycine decarboxlase T-protein (GDC-T) [Chara braunii]|eukprot:GBG62519.1 Glycine decarboxlase T-protein (GDC-T) [Chara braunii]
MDAGVEVVDLHAYIAKIDREFKTQRYDDIDAPLLYVRIETGEATCIALIDCGASRNYMSQDFMVRAGLGPRVRRKSQPTQVTLADGHTHKSIDRCIDNVPMYFAPHASEAVSFDILDTKFDMILGMSWLRSEDHPVNFYRRTVHIRDRNGVLVPCTVAPPHPSVSCHVVSAASMRASIIRDYIEEMGVCFLHALPPQDASSTDSSSDPRITRLLDAYNYVFEGPHGVVPDRPICHEIILEDGAVPPRGCIYRMSEEELSVLRAQLDDLLEKGWIRPSSSPYGAPVLFVRKKNKDLRLCIDYCKLNEQTIRNAGPLPRIDDLLERLGGAKFFSKLDLKSGYHQLEIRKEDRYKTTRSLEEHVEYLRTVLERLRQAKYKANRDKCEFARQELEYLGHYVTPQGIRPLADKIEALRVWPEPTNTTDVRSFMGLAGYYQRFITGYSRIAAPMTRLQSPKVPFVFDDDARRSFQTLKTAMLMAPVRSIYDPTLPTRVTTDASDYGIGAVLEQHDGVDWHPVEYFSHKVPPINSLDDARKKELLAFDMALKRWRHFLLGRRRFTWDIQTKYGAIFDEDSGGNVAVTFGNDVEAIDAAKTHAVVIDRTHYGRIRVSDEDRIRFLHNQSTADFQILKQGQGCDTVFVTPTARTIDLATAYIMNSSVIVVTSPSLRHELVTTLDKYIFFADKVKVEDITDRTAMLSIIGPKSGEILEDMKAEAVVGTPYGTNMHFELFGEPVTIASGAGLASEGYTLIMTPDSAGLVWENLVGKGAVPMGEAAWEKLRILEGRPSPGKELTGDYNPLEAGLWKTISLTKGCYIGQETIARVITYDALKQQLWGLELEGLAEPGTIITAANSDEKVGKLTSFAEVDGKFFGLGYIKRTAGGEGMQVSVGGTKGLVVEVPYLTRSLTQ